MASDPDRQSLLDFLNTTDSARFRQRRTHRLPLQAYQAVQATYFFTLCALRPGAPFLNHALAEAVVSGLRWRRERHRWSLYGYCLMPDHFHVIARLSKTQGGETVSEPGGVPPSVLDQIRDFKRYTTRQIWWK